MRSNQWFAHFVFSTFPCRVHNTYQGPEKRINSIGKVKMLVLVIQEMIFGGAEFFREKFKNKQIHQKLKNCKL